MPRPSFLRAALVAASLSFVAHSSRAFTLIGTSWGDGNIVMQLQLGPAATPLIDGAADWATVAESALNEWNQITARSKFTVVRDSTAAIARGNRLNNVAFMADIYGTAFDSRTLAVTLGSTSTTIARQSTEKDVIFNSGRTWSSYRGALRSGTSEFRRVALHEFGHVLGLDHPDQATPFQNVDAVMNSTVSATESLRPDDIAGAHAIYDLTPTTVRPVGGSFTLDVATSGAGPFTYQWYFRAAGVAPPDPFNLAKEASYTIGSVQPVDAGTYTVTATSSSGVFFSRTATLSVTPIATSADTTLANISTRGVVGSGSGVLIAGLVIGGTTPKTVLIRAAGPALADFGVTGALADPTLSIVNGQSTVVAQNDNWEIGGNSAAIVAASTRLGAFQFKTGSRDAAVLATLPPGSYTAIVSGVGGATGVALVETYDADPDAATSRTRKLVNIATRGQVGTGENVLIAGLVVTGPGPHTYLIRAVGPTLTRAPFNISDALRDPVLQIYQGATLLRENDDWDVPVSGQQDLRDAATRVGAFSLQEVRSNSGLDAVMLVTLQPGSYTAKVSGFQGATGVALVEIYEMP